MRYIRRERTTLSDAYKRWLLPTEVAITQRRNFTAEQLLEPLMCLGEGMDQCVRVLRVDEPLRILANHKPNSAPAPLQGYLDAELHEIIFRFVRRAVGYF